MAWEGKHVNVSRLICRLSHGDPPDEAMHAAHKCGNGKHGCVNPSCIYWATPVENESDKLRHGTRPKGEQCGFAKLTDVQAAAIREDNRSGTLIAKDYGVSQSQVSKIKSGKSRVM
jgi:hypothetical protein